MEGLGIFILLILFINIGVPILVAYFVIRYIFNIRWWQNKELVENMKQAMREVLAEYKENTDKQNKND